MAEVGVLLRPITGSNVQVTPHLRYIALGKVPRKRYMGLKLHMRHGGLDMKGKS